jgi:hypothetical protein
LRLNREEARGLARTKLEAFRGLSYSELKALLSDHIHEEVTGESGAVYQLDCYAVWDDKPDGDLRVTVAVDDSGWSAFRPLVEDFIVSPTGEFVGE